VLFVAGRPRAALLAAIGPALAAAITEWVLKPLIGRTLSGAYSFPSGHTTGIFAVAFVVVVAMLDRAPPRPRALVALVVSVLSLVVAAGVAAALVADHYHYATDTVGGAGVALATVAIVGLGIDLTFDALA
jgi:membrane-associated phospholipid phosphatase